LRGFGDGDQIIQIVDGDGNDIGGVSIGDDGLPHFDGESDSAETGGDGGGEGGEGGGGGFYGEVVSGSGSTYTVDVEGVGNVTVTQLQIDGDETIPAGTMALVVQVGENYFMQVPVWLEDES
jgi:hypothetical protein